jgi:hypothetical protein
MNINEEFLEEREELASVEQPTSDNALLGGETVAPDTTILGDLKELANLTFGTRWSDSGSSYSHSERPHNFQRRRPIQNRNNSPYHTNRPQSITSNEHPHQEDSFQERPPREGSFRERSFRERRESSFNDRRRENRNIVPPFEVQFYQEDNSFNLLLDEMRKNCKTYELFTIARLILQKPERFVAVIRRRPNIEGVSAPLYLSLLDDLVFESENEAMAYTIEQHVEEFFDVMEEELEAPKGRFTCVHRCGITKKLLSAPNYHKYRSILREHFNTEIYSMPFERFLLKIETTKDENDIQAWVQQMSHRKIYIPKIIDEGITELTPLDSLEKVKNYLLQHVKDRILREIPTVRIIGKLCSSMPSKAIGRALQFFLQRQRNFPFETATNLRHRFRRAGFGIYRKGKGGISYVCAVRRQFRTNHDVFEPNIQALIAFLEPLNKITLPIIKKDYIEAQQLPEKEVWNSLNWLIREGYVVDYENGFLSLNPKLTSSENSKFLTEGAEEKPEEHSVIQLDMIETAIEKRSDGTLTIVPETKLAVPIDNSKVLEFGMFVLGGGQCMRMKDSDCVNGTELNVTQPENNIPLTNNSTPNDTTSNVDEHPQDDGPSDLLNH